MEVEKGMDEEDASQVGPNGASTMLAWTEWSIGHVFGHKLMAWPAGPSSALHWIWTESTRSHNFFKHIY